MSEAIKEINIEEIMKEIRADIQTRSMLENIPDFADIDVSPDMINATNTMETLDIAECIRDLNDTYEVGYFELYQGNPLKVFIKKVLRKILKFLILPITERQNLFNANVVKYVNAKEKAGTDSVQIAGMSGEQLEKYFMNQEKLVESLESKVILMEERIRTLEAQLEEK